MESMSRRWVDSGAYGSSRFGSTSSRVEMETFPLPDLGMAWADVVMTVSSVARRDIVDRENIMLMVWLWKMGDWKRETLGEVWLYRPLKIDWWSSKLRPRSRLRLRMFGRGCASDGAVRSELLVLGLVRSTGDPAWPNVAS